MLRTVIVLGLVVLAIVYVAKDRKDTTAVKRVDSDLALTEKQVARVSAFTLLAPTGLPHAWAPTSVSYLATPAADGHQVFHVGFVTPSGKYADLEESDTDVSRVLAVFAGKSSTAQGDIQVGAQQTSLAAAPDGTRRARAPSRRSRHTRARVSPCSHNASDSSSGIPPASRRLTTSSRAARACS
jgi:hypothetical protein